MILAPNGSRINRENIQSRLILDTVRRDERFLKQPPPEVVVITLGAYFVKIALKVWLRDPRIHIPVREELREAIKNALDKAGIIMPYETLALVKHDRDRKNQTSSSLLPPLSPPPHTPHP